MSQTDDTSSSDEEDYGSLGLSMVSITGPSRHDCGYCKGKDTSISFGIWAHNLTCKDYQDLIDRGWRRSGKYLYKPDLEKSCCPQYTIRLDASKFNMTKSQKKVVAKFNKYIKGKSEKKSASLKEFMHEAEEQTEAGDHTFKVELEPASWTQEKFDLYAKYQHHIHHDKKEDISKHGFKRFLVDSPLTQEGNYGSYHQKYLLDGQLIALAVLDILPSCVSSVYFLYDPDYGFLSLGKYSALREISLVQDYHTTIDTLHYYYMGFYIHTCPKMNYKGRYAPSDLLDPIDYTWHPIETFKSQLDHQSFVSFVQEKPGERSWPAGWVDPALVETEKVTDQVFVMIGEGRIAPVNCLVKFDASSRFKKEILDYIAAVGIPLAQKMILC
ncbi:arginine-tRNA-protein transferase [Choanephora cucurbitarum]|nr:arginine-tRNA-protein transferase [Choanephora cucurbitarum]